MTGGAFLVTGATGPVGEATVRLLAERGDRLLLTGRNEQRLAELDKAYGVPGKVETYRVDVTSPEGAREAADAARRQLGTVDGLVHMVGSFHAGPVVRTDPADYNRLLQANFLSAVYTTQALMPLSGGGRLVYFGTPLVHEPLAAMGGYAASKAALLTWMRAFSHEVKHQGVHANAVLMTMADTPEARRERPHVDFSQAVSPELVARAVGFLTSEAADGLYGALVPVLGQFGFTTALAGRGPGGPGGRPGPPDGRG